MDWVHSCMDRWKAAEPSCDRPLVLLVHSCIDLQALAAFAWQDSYHLLACHMGTASGRAFAHCMPSKGVPFEVTAAPKSLKTSIAFSDLPCVEERDVAVLHKIAASVDYEHEGPVRFEGEVEAGADEP